MYSKTKKLVTMALLIAISVVLSIYNWYPIPGVNTIRVSFTYIPNSLGSAMFGPVAGMIMAIPCDLLGYIINPHGNFFPGYTLNLIISNLIYGLFLYRKELKWWRVCAAQLLVVLVVSLGLNSLWLVMQGGSAGAFYNLTRLVKTAVEYPFQVAIIMFFVQLSRKINPNLYRKAKYE